MRTGLDLVIRNATVRTMDAAGTVADSLGIKGDRIVGVGQWSELAPFVDARTRTVDAGGRAVFPGFIDGHTHFHKGAVARHLILNWNGGENHPASIPAALEQLRDKAAGCAPGEWIRADGLNERRLPEQRLPTRWEIDRVAPDNPVVLVTTGNHAVVANSPALAAAGIDRSTPDPPGGRLERDETGDVTGVLRETAKLRLDNNRADNVIPKYEVADRMGPITETIRAFHEIGITSIHDVMVDPLEIATWIRLHRQGELNIRVQMLIRGIETKTPLEHLVALGLEDRLGDDWLRLGGVKLSVDGAYRGAAVYQAHPGEPDNFGLDRISAEELERAVRICHRNNLRLAVHVVGPRATDMTLDAFEKAFDGAPAAHMRHRLEHLILPHTVAQLERISRLGLIASVQPRFISSLGDGWSDLWPTEESRTGVMPFHALSELGVPLMGGTDFNGDLYSPFEAMRASVTRLTPSGMALDPAQALTVDQAVRLQTTGAAFGGFDEQVKVSLEEGKLADVVIASQDPYRVDPTDLGDIQVEATIVGGQVVFDRSGLASS